MKDPDDGDRADKIFRWLNPRNYPDFGLNPDTGMITMKPSIKSEKSNTLLLGGSSTCDI